MDSNITLLHIASPGATGVESRMDWLVGQVKRKSPGIGLEYEIRYSDNLVETLDDILGKGGFDILAMLEKERVSLLDRFSHKDLVKRMVFHSRVPLLSFKPRT